jgi:PAS domain S-box-containing protein
MADRGGNRRETAARAPVPALDVPLPVDLPPSMFTGPGLLALADLLPVMTAYVDRSEVFRFANKPYAEWLGVPRKEIIGRTMRQVLGDKNYAERKAMIEAAMAGERTFFAATYEHPTRGTLALNIDYVPWVVPGGAEPQGICIVINDITEQRASERALRESEARFRRIANQAPVLMWVTRLDRTRDFVNDAYMEYLGTEDRELARTYDWRSGIHPDDLERVLA